ncbi:LOW QUALITY PROTEIN: uncharacterized protein LOC120163293 [Hibiscus syriacus]|uniref:LOW QUALITY PROTEIN: uncharacterized protein LOC120163293 n=1 Tax=Hibiscus syriacus TaxID=106335 RepID=UPI00192186C9|nr:LOW QUALITY PROTEIN: uncharacterized protein LOC120163293 [Hibiscus syriacus]
MMIGEIIIDEEQGKQIKSLEERMKSVEITESFYGFDASELSLVPDLILPIKFKAPEFDKYNGTTCPSSHITMFCRRMVGYVKDKKLLIHCFQDSLTGPALKWYTQLTKANIRSWKDLAKAFLEQYRHVTDMVPDRWTLQNLEKKNNETFRQYAQRWRDTAAQVQPLLSEKEATIMFVHTLKAPYLNHLMGNATRNFADLVISGELIENVLKSGKIESNDGSSSKFLKFLKHSEYSVVEQLHKQQARISILDLLMNSEAHRNALMKILNQTFIPEDISLNKLDRIVGHIAADNYITFTDDEIPEGGMGSVRALNITTHCHGHVLPGVLIDNGSALNLMPLVTLQRMPLDQSHMKSYQNVVRAFDGTQKEVLGKMEIPLLIGPVVYNIDFVVMDIHPTYNCLLGRPWIHSAGAVPSSLHQKLKFVIDGQLICVNAEEEDVPTELLRLVEKEDKQILPHKEEVETVNLGTDEKRKEVKIGTTLTVHIKQELINLLQEFKDIFAWSYQDMPGLSTDIVIHKLPINPEYKPVQQKLRRMRPEMLLQIKEEVMKQINAGFLKASKYPEWVANIVPVPNKNGKVRMCVDYRDLNKASPKDSFPLPHIDTLVDNTAGHAWFSFMDGFSGYNQIKMNPEDMEKTTFITMWGTFCYKVMPFGLKNAGATYQRAMVTLFHDMMHKEIEVYVDDMIAKSRTEEEHIQNLRKLFQRLRRYQLKLNPAKCIFGVTSGKLLGFVVSKKGIEIDPDKVKAIQDLPPPNTKKEVRGFLGRLNYISRFISQLTDKCDPVFKLLRKNNPEVWNEECQETLDIIKKYLSNPPILVSPIPDRPLILYLTVFENSMGCVLGQHDKSGRKEKAIYYLSKKFTDCEVRYPPIQKLCCALVWTTRRLRQYMLYHTTWLISKLDPLKFLMESPALTGRMARWQMLLSEFDIIYVNQKAIKGSVIADFLASRVSNDYQPLNFNFPDEDLLCISMNEKVRTNDEFATWKLYFDGASNALGRGIGAVLISPENVYYPFTSRLEFFCTNNMAEYEACVMGLKAAIERKIKFLKIYGDSSLVVYQLRGEWETKDPKLLEYRNFTLELVKEFERVTFNYLPREENQMADALATLAAMFQANKKVDMMPIKMQVYEIPAHCYSVEEEVDGKPWYHDILQYIKNQSYPPNASEIDKRTLRRMAAGYFLDGDIMYRRSSDQMLLRCLNTSEARNVIKEVHSGICGTHANGLSMARKIMRYGYYWATMYTDCIDYARKCHKCQIYADKIHVPPSPLHVMTAPWPFSMWGIDVIGAITPKASNGHCFILVAIDYFTKWVEAASYTNIKRSTVCKFIKKEIICRYGLPERIITDNALNLNNKMMTELCTQFKIKHANSVAYRPKMNGAVEAANKNIKRIITKTTETYKDWHEKLPFALYAYRTTVRTSTGATPFSLVYGMEAVLPIEVEIPSLRILRETKLDESEWIQARVDQLNLIEEKRLKAICHGQMYQKRMMKSHDKKVHPREFQEGDLVLKKILPIHKDFRGKWMPNWEGPYVVKKAFSGGALILAEMDGKILKNPINSDSVKKYYA